MVAETGGLVAACLSLNGNKIPAVVSSPVAARPDHEVRHPVLAENASSLITRRVDRSTVL